MGLQRGRWHPGAAYVCVALAVGLIVGGGGVLSRHSPPSSTAPSAGRGPAAAGPSTAARGASTRPGGSSPSPAAPTATRPPGAGPTGTSPSGTDGATGAQDGPSGNAPETISPGGASSPSSSRRRSGIYLGACNLLGEQQAGAWRGRPLERRLQFLDDSSWSSIDSPGYALTCAARSSVPTTWAVPLLPKQGATLRIGATGAYDEHFRSLARLLVANGMDGSTLRLGWEFNGSWSPWRAATDPAAFRAYWVRVVTAMRSVPGQHFRIDWSPATGRPVREFAAAEGYPGDAYVDDIGTSVYDFDFGTTVTTPQQRWLHLLQQPDGLLWQAAFAAAHHKKLSFPEWGLDRTDDYLGSGGGDDPFFVEQMYAFMASHPTDYEVYFDKDRGGTHHVIVTDGVTGPSFPAAAAAYRRLFG